MKNLNLVLAFIASMLLTASPLFAQEETTVEDASCQVVCDEGQSKVSFADGGRVACACSPASTGMDATTETEAPCTDANDDGQCD